MMGNYSDIVVIAESTGLSVFIAWFIDSVLPVWEEQARAESKYSSYTGQIDKTPLTFMFCHYGLSSGKWHEECEFDVSDWIYLLSYLKDNQAKFGDFGIM